MYCVMIDEKALDLISKERNMAIAPVHELGGKNLIEIALTQ